MTCKDSCLCFDVCSKYGGKLFKSIAEDHSCDKCPNLKDKSRFIELPVTFGSELFVIKRTLGNNFCIDERGLFGITINFIITDTNEYINKKYIGSKVFFDKSKAEEKLKELNQ